MNATNKKKVFIGSSSEGQKLADSIKFKLKDVAECVIWSDSQITPKSNQPTLDWIIDNVNSDNFDFAIMIFTADDKTEFRGEEKFAPRDNVLFELGLFMSKLGKDRVFILYNQLENIKIPSDLLSAQDFRFASDTPIKDIQLGDLDKLHELSVQCEKIEEKIRNSEEFISLEKKFEIQKQILETNLENHKQLLETELGAVYRIVNAFTTPTFPDIRTVFFDRLAQSRFNEVFDSIPDVINFAKEIIADYFYPQLFAETDRSKIRIYFAYFLGDGIELRNQKIDRCFDIRQDVSNNTEIFDGRFVVGFSNPVYAPDLGLQHRWQLGNVFSCFNQENRENLSNCAAVFDTMAPNYISLVREKIPNHYIEDEKSVYSAPVLYGTNRAERAALGVLAVSHNEPYSINKIIREKAYALSIMLGYLFKLYADSIPAGKPLPQGLPKSWVPGLNTNSSDKFKRRVVKVRQEIALYFENRFLSDNTHHLLESNNEYKLFTGRAVNFKDNDL